MRLRSSLRAEGSAPISLFAFQDIIFAATGIFLFVAILMTLFGKIDLISTEAFEENETLRLELKSLAEEFAVTSRKLAALEAASSSPEKSETSLTNLPSSAREENIWLYDIEELFAHNAGLRETSRNLYNDLTAEIMEMNRREQRLDLLQTGGYESLQSQGIAIVREGQAHDFREAVFLLVDKNGFEIVFHGRSELNQEFAKIDELKAHIEESFKPDTQSFLIQLRPSGIKQFNSVKSMLTQLGYSIGFEPVAMPHQTPEE